jgi:hypothetical protein
MRFRRISGLQMTQLAPSHGHGDDGHATYAGATAFAYKQYPLLGCFDIVFLFFSIT